MSFEPEFLSSFATLDDAYRVVKLLCAQLDNFAHDISTAHKRPDGREVWTKAIWTSFDHVRSALGDRWDLFPPQISKGSGRAKGEFLVDFILFDNRLGPRIACESELDPTRLAWAFDKLRCVKSDIKLLIFELPFESSLPNHILNVAREYLTNFALYEGEIFVFVQLHERESKVFAWQASETGPIDASNFVPRELD